MKQTVLIIVSIVAGVLLGALSNWLYDLLRRVGVFPDKPSFKRLMVVILGFLPLVLLVALPAIVSYQSSRRPSLEDASIKITNMIPPPEDTVFTSDVERPVIVNLEYYLPSPVDSPQMQLQYLTSYRPGESGGWNWYVIHTLPAEAGQHRAQLAGEVRPPVKSLLNGEAFQIGVFLTGLDQETGQKITLASDVATFILVDD